jgi:hypothetical protein
MVRLQAVLGGNESTLMLILVLTCVVGARLMREAGLCFTSRLCMSHAQRTRSRRHGGKLVQTNHSATAQTHRGKTNKTYLSDTRSVRVGRYDMQASNVVQGGRRPRYLAGLGVECETLGNGRGGGELDWLRPLDGLNLKGHVAPWNEGEVAVAGMLQAATRHTAA